MVLVVRITFRKQRELVFPEPLPLLLLRGEGQGGALQVKGCEVFSCETLRVIMMMMMVVVVVV
jgi:hypothetical protein